jgi:hypothetical protein
MPTGGLMLLVGTIEHNGIVSSAENQSQLRNSPNTESGALKFNENEASTQLQIPKSTGDFRTY